MCIDYRDLNKRTIINDPYPLPRIDALMDTLGKGKYFCALDLISGYHQVPMTERAQEKSAFITPQMSPSHWEYIYMPFGLMGAPATFQRLVDTMLRGIQYNNVLAYLDDIVVIGQTVAECCRDLEKVFERIRTAKLKLKPSKCELFKTTITYLGHVVSAQGIQTDPKKVHAIKDWAIPLYVTDVRGFLGFCNYYKKFIANYIDLTRPLNKLLCKDTALVWGEEQTTAFNKLKEALAKAPLLAHPRDDCTYILDTDASSYGIGGVLAQMQPYPNEEGKEELTERPIAYHGRLLLPREMRYCARRREMLAIYEMTQYFRCYLAGRKFIIRTDHHSLEGVKNLAKLTPQMARWMDALEEYQFEIHIRKGKEHENADFLSRLYTDCFCKHREVFLNSDTTKEALEEEPILDWDLFNKCCREQADRRLRNEQDGLIHIHDVEALKTLKDSDLELQKEVASRLTFAATELQVARIDSIRHFAKVQKVQMMALTTSSEEEEEEEMIQGEEYARWTPWWTRDQMKEKQEEDEDLKEYYARLATPGSTKIQWEDIVFKGEACKYYFGQRYKLRMVEGLLYRAWISMDGMTTWKQLMIPRVLQQDILEQVHKTPTGCHQGFRRTWEFLRRRFFWFEMGKQLRRLIRTCEDCQKKKNLNISPRWPMTIHGAGFRNERVTLDMCGPMRFPRVEFQYLLVICDSYTKYVVAVPLKGSTAEEICQAFLDRWANVFGFPYNLHTDQGSNLTSEMWREFCKIMSIEKTRTTAYRPQANGQNERTNKTIVEWLRTTQTQHEDWCKRVGHVCFAFNATPHAAHGYSPYYLMFGAEPFCHIDVRMPSDPEVIPQPVNEHVRIITGRMNDANVQARLRLREAAEVMKRFYDRNFTEANTNVKVQMFVPGDRVLLKASENQMPYGKLSARFEGPYYVIAVTKNGVVRIKDEDNRMKPPKVVHHDKLRRFYEKEKHEMPTWIREAIDSFNSHKDVSIQTGETCEDDEEMAIDELTDEEEEAQACNICKEKKNDVHGIIRIITDKVCHLCKREGDVADEGI